AEHPFGMRLGVGEDEGTAPGDALHDPRLDPEVLALRLEIGDEIRGGDPGEFHRSGLSGVRSSLPAAALGQGDHAGAVRRGVPAVTRGETPAGPAVEVEGGHPVRGARLLPVDLVPAAHGEAPARGDRRRGDAHRASAQGAAGFSRVQFARRLRAVWQRGHQKTVRAAISPKRIEVPHSRQGRDWRWWTENYASRGSTAGAWSPVLRVPLRAR